MGGRCAALCIVALSFVLGGCGRLGFDSVLGEQGSHDSLHGNAQDPGDDDAGPSGAPGDGDESSASDAGAPTASPEPVDAGTGSAANSDASVSASGAGDAGYDAGTCNSRYCGGGGWGGGGGGGWGGGGRRGGGFH